MRAPPPVERRRAADTLAPTVLPRERTPRVHRRLHLGTKGSRCSNTASWLRKFRVCARFRVITAFAFHCSCPPLPTVGGFPTQRTKPRVTATRICGVLSVWLCWMIEFADLRPAAEGLLHVEKRRR